MSGFPPNLFRGSRYAVVGLGRNGLPAMRRLSEMGASVVGWDDAAYARQSALAEGFDIHDPEEEIFSVDALILSPGIPHTWPSPHRLAAAARSAGVPILTDAEMLFQAVTRAGTSARFFGITGTNGKSTTTALLAHILAEAGIDCAAGANLGPAALSLPWLERGVYVLEMSSYMLERLATLRFDAAAMLNFSADHLDRHGDLAGYWAAKAHIFDRQRASMDVAVVGVDDEAGRQLATRMPGCVTISGAHTADIWCDRGVLRDASGPIVEMSRAGALPGVHNAQNAAAAAALALHAGVSRALVASGIESFPGLAHRQEFVGETGGIRFINDSKATNADAAQHAMACYGRFIWIAGGIAKSGGIATLSPLFPRVAEALLIGRDAPDFAQTLRDAGVRHRIVGTLEAAVTQSLESARLHGALTVLLSPACASFDQFASFEARGDRFRQLVTALDGPG